MKVKIEGTAYSRDLTNMSLLCNDKSVKNRYEEQLKTHKDNLRRDEEINNIKNDISEIKSMLQILIKGH